MCFPINFAKFLKTTFLHNSFGRPLLTLFIVFEIDFTPLSKTKEKVKEKDIFVRNNFKRY